MNDEERDVEQGEVEILGENQVVEEVRKHFSSMVFDTIIRRNIRLGEAPSYGESIIAYDATSKGAINYLNLAQELLKKNS